MEGAQVNVKARSRNYKSSRGVCFEGGCFHFSVLSLPIRGESVIHRFLISPQYHPYGRPIFILARNSASPTSTAWCWPSPNMCTKSLSEAMATPPSRARCKCSESCRSCVSPSTSLLNAVATPFCGRGSVAAISWGMVLKSSSRDALRPWAGLLAVSSLEEDDRILSQANFCAQTLFAHCRVPYDIVCLLVPRLRLRDGLASFSSLWFQVRPLRPPPHQTANPDFRLSTIPCSGMASSSIFSWLRVRNFLLFAPGPLPSGT